jgi:general secretion pathway protein I
MRDGTEQASFEEGFTLLEMMVALAILVVSMGLLFKLIGTDLERTREASRQTEAAALLQSLLARSEVSPQTGTSTGAFADGFSWKLAVQPYGGEGPRAVDAVSIAATISWQHGAQIENRSLVAYRVVPKALPQ